MPELILIIFLSMVFGQVWVFIIQPDEILDFVGPVIDGIKSEKIKKLFTCPICFSGQLSLWVYIAFCFVYRHEYSPIEHMIVVACTIWLAIFQVKLFNSFERQ